MNETVPADIAIEITGFHLRLGGCRAVLELETGPATAKHSGEMGDVIARFDFRPGATPLAFASRHGFISVVRPLDMLAATMDMLRNDAPVFLDANGVLTTHQRFADQPSFF